jgi:hypothetical protein
MPIIRYISAIILLIVLHQSPLAWAEGEDTSSPVAPPLQQEALPLQGQPSDPEQQGAPSPLVNNVRSSPSDTSPKPEAAELVNNVHSSPSDTLSNIEATALDEDIQSAPSDTCPIPLTTISELGLIDKLHGEICEGILTTAVWLDSFFADERMVKEINRSYIRVRYDVFQEEKANITVQPTINVRLALPELEKKAHIVISAEEDELETAADTPAPAGITGDPIGKTEDRNITTAVQYIFKDTEKHNFITRTGLQFSHGSPVLLIAPRYRYFVPFTTWDFRFTQEAAWKSDTKWQVDTLFDLERQLPRDLFFRSSLGGTWIEDTDGYFYSLGFSLRQPWGPKYALDYSWVNSYRTRPVYALTEILLSIRYRQDIWRHWLFFEVAPQVRFPRTAGFEAIPGVLFRFEMFFGKRT